MQNLDLVVYGVVFDKVQRLESGVCEILFFLYFWMFLSSTQYANCRYRMVRQRPGTALESSVIKYSLLSSVNRILLFIWSRWLVVQNSRESTSCECSYTYFTILCFVFVFSFVGINTVTAKRVSGTPLRWYAQLESQWQAVGSSD